MSQGRAVAPATMDGGVTPWQAPRSRAGLARDYDPPSCAGALVNGRPG